MATLRELLSELDVAVRAGEEGLDAAVRWVHISELEDPTPFLRGGELLLTTGMALATAEQQEAYVDLLADHGLAGLGLGTGLGHDEVPAALRAAAARRGFPLVEVPYDVPFIAVTERAAARLVNEGYATLQRSIAAQERLQRIVLSERGLDAIVGATASLVRGTVLVFDGRGALRSRADGAKPLTGEELAALTHELHERARRAEPRGFVPGGEALARRALALPVLSPDAPTGGVPQAWLVAASDRGALEAFDRLVLHQAVTATALELLRRRVADSTERRLAGDVLNEVVRGEVDGPELARRLEPFGLGARTAALVVDPSGASRSVQAAVEGALAGALRDEALAGLVATTGRLTCALVPGAEEEELVEVAERLHGRLASALGTALPAGLGRPAPLGRARETLHEARCALEARQMSGPPRQNGHAPRAVATFRDLGSFQLLLNLQDTDQLRLFCESLLGPIEQGEGHYGGELMRSLEAFIDANGQWEAAARVLYCHRHTLRYRIRRVEELTGRDLSTARDRIEFWLALRGREMI